MALFTIGSLGVHTVSVSGAKIQEFRPLGRSSEKRNANDRSLRKQHHKDGRKSVILAGNEEAKGTVTDFKCFKFIRRKCCFLRLLWTG